MATLKFECVRHQGTAGSYRQMLPWLLTIAFLAAFGALAGERVLALPYGGVVLGIVEGGAILTGLFLTFVRAQKPPAVFYLRVDGGQVTLSDATGAPLWNGSGRNFSRQCYVMRSKYGSYRFPVASLGSAPHLLRVGVWDPSDHLAFAGAAEGPAPQYLLGAPDWPKFVAALDARS